MTFIRYNLAKATWIIFFSCLHLQGIRDKNCQKISVHINLCLFKLFFYDIIKVQSIMLCFLDTVKYFLFKISVLMISSLLLLSTNLRNNLRIYTTKYFFLPPLKYAICPQYSCTQHYVLDCEKRWQLRKNTPNVCKARIYKMVANAVPNNHYWMLLSCHMDFESIHIFHYIWFKHI